MGGADQGRFTIGPSTGELRFATAPDFGAPGYANVDNIYLVTVEATDASGNTSQQAVTITVTDVAEDTILPRIGGPSGGAGDGTSETTVNEGQTTVATFSANEGVTWSMTSGNDQGRLVIDPNTGALRFFGFSGL